MTTKELYNKLQDAYSVQNLNRITVTLIRLYKDEQFGTLRQIAEMISDSTEITIDDKAKYFPRLMMLYHPDRGDYHRNEIEKMSNNNDYNGLLGYSHILLLNRIEEIAATLASYEDIDYSPVYEWDINLEGFTIINTGNNIRTSKSVTSNHKRGYSFYEGICMRMFGDTSTSFPPYYLEDIDEFELSKSGIIDLDGIEYCIHAITIDLSDNAISDLSPLWGLTQLQELNLSDNKIEEIETLVNLRNLKSLNLSNNAIKDISYLMQLPNLQFVNLTGTKVSSSQIFDLEESGVCVKK